LYCLGKRRQARQLDEAANDNDSSQPASGASSSVAGIGTQHRTENSSQLIEVGAHILLSCPERRETILNFARGAIQDVTLGIPRPSILPTLIRLNVLDAVARNARVLGFRLTSLCADELVSPFNQAGPNLPSSTPEASYPHALRPTALQIEMVHHPWSDLIPIPGFRDNLLRAIELGFDEDLVCADLLRVDEEHGERGSLIVWGEPWDIRGWEASVPFLQKWGWLIQGCTEILEATNYWRERRGEKRLRF
jgi:hypothetical protein